MNEKITDKARDMFEKATGYVTLLNPSSESIFFLFSFYQYLLPPPLAFLTRLNVFVLRFRKDVPDKVSN